MVVGGRSTGLERAGGRTTVVLVGLLRLAPDPVLAGCARVVDRVDRPVLARVPAVFWTAVLSLRRSEGLEVPDEARAALDGRSRVGPAEVGVLRVGAVARVDSAALAEPVAPRVDAEPLPLLATRRLR